MEDKKVKCQNGKEVNVEETLDKLNKRVKNLNDLLEIKDKVIINFTKDINKIDLENFNLKNENEKLRKEKSRLSSKLQALTEMYNECKKENDDLKREINKSKTLCDDCELQHKECHCDCTREFIPKDKMEGTKDKVEMVKLEITDMYNEYDMEVIAALTGILLHGLVL